MTNDAYDIQIEKCNYDSWFVKVSSRISKFQDSHSSQIHFLNLSFWMRGHVPINYLNYSKFSLFSLFILEVNIPKKKLWTKNEWTKEISNKERKSQKLSLIIKYNRLIPAWDWSLIGKTWKWIKINASEAAFDSDWKLSMSLHEGYITTHIFQKWNPKSS